MDELDRIITDIIRNNPTTPIGVTAELFGNEFSRMESQKIRRHMESLVKYGILVKTPLKITTFGHASYVYEVVE